MTTTRTQYLVSTYNDTPINDAYFTYNRLEADLLISESIKKGVYGMLIEIITTENKELDYKKEIRNIIKEF